MAGDRARVVVVAPDSFKGSLSAPDAAAAIAAGIIDAAGPDVEVRRRPVADGGEGTVEAVLAAGWTPVEVRVSGPIGEPVDARFALSPLGPAAHARAGGDGTDSAQRPTAVVELATAAGLGLLPGGRPDPLHASTSGVGELVRAALDAGARRLVLGLGGSATTDGGTGMAAALGVRFLDAAGVPLPPGGAPLADLARVDVSGLDPRLRDAEVVVACDVDNPLTGPSGAAHVYGPQKGATPADVEVLDAALRRLAQVLRRDVGADVDAVPGAGAAGGVGAAALAFLGARLAPGIDLLLDLTGFDAALAGADLVVTGEGSLDSQSLSGKAPVGVARRANARGLPVVVLAGRVDLDAATRHRLGALGVTATYALLDLQPDPDLAQRDAGRLLRTLAAQVFTHA